ncbi:hypothetical protein KM043_015251 [Ampulex compressa]|nr:hypothetical protein KM043_015251 [Ampulex compressa]
MSGLVERLAGDFPNLSRTFAQLPHKRKAHATRRNLAEDCYVTREFESIVLARLAADETPAAPVTPSLPPRSCPLLLRLFAYCDHAFRVFYPFQPRARGTERLRVERLSGNVSSPKKERGKDYAVRNSPPLSAFNGEEPCATVEQSRSINGDRRAQTLKANIGFPH